jgi:uncharacterized OB-fold protein
MSLRRCPDCGKAISSQAAACPYCGRERMDVTLPGPGWLWVLIVLTGFASIPLVMWYIGHHS